MIVLDQSRCLVDAALNFTRFFRNESCGKCVPCRVGTQKLVDLIKLVRAGEVGHSIDRVGDDIERLHDVLEKASICGLGQVASAPIRSVTTGWPGEVEDHFLRRHCPANVCFNPREFVV